MAIIYENKVKELGKDIMMMNGGDFIIIFGDSAPAELRDYCYSVDVNPINGEIKAGQTLKIDENGMTTASQLYSFLELHPAHFSDWCRRNIKNNKFATKKY